MQNLEKLALEENDEHLVLWVSVRWAYMNVHDCEALQIYLK